jgi:hypothetical protein
VHGMSSGVHGPTHLADLVRPALKRRNSPANEAGDNVLQRQAGITQVILNPVESIDWPHRVLGVIGPVLPFSGWSVNIWRQVEQVNLCGILYIEEAFLPFLA